MVKKIFSMLLCLVFFLLTMTFGVSAKMVQEEEEEIQVQPRYSYTVSTGTSLYMSNGSLICHGEVEGYYGVATKVTITLRLQKKVLFWWSDEQEWTETYNQYYGSSTKSKANPKGGTYRTEAVYTVYSGSSSETITGYSSELKI